MRLEPGRYRWVRVYAADFGEPGCQSWQVRPRLGLLGMLMGWWEVKHSSGCPLATARAARRAPEVFPPAPAALVGGDPAETHRRQDPLVILGPGGRR
jgi:hypothetical protein